MAAQTASKAPAVLHSEAEIRIMPINGFIGAEIEGVDLRRPLSPDQFRVVHDAFDFRADEAVDRFDADLRFALQHGC